VADQFAVKPVVVIDVAGDPEGAGGTVVTVMTFELAETPETLVALTRNL
jgi:hypothetical protein